MPGPVGVGGVWPGGAPAAGMRGMPGGWPPGEAHTKQDPTAATVLCATSLGRSLPSIPRNEIDRPSFLLRSEGEGGASFPTRCCTG
jgi:hypothetical protein